MHYEKKLEKQGYKFIAGIDEAGRGSWAGPLLVGVVILPLNKLFKFRKINDSKKILADKRIKLELVIKKNCLAWATGQVENFEIDRFGLQNAHLLAVERAVNNLKINPDYILVDRIAKVKFQIPFENVIEADSKFVTVGAASILAKVERDRQMINFTKKYPEYCFEKHKGYGTKLHQQRINQYGLCEIHRRAFEPVRELDKTLHLF